MKISRSMLALLLAVLLMVTVAACGKKPEADEPEPTTTTTEILTITTEATTTTTEPEVPAGPAMNEDIFSEWDKSYADIAAKYGPHTDNSYYNGGKYYKFPGGYGAYFFGGQSTQGDLNPSDKCFLIMAKMDDVFMAFDAAVTPAGLAEKYDGLSFVDTGENLMDGGYFSRFTYRDFTVIIEHQDQAQIGLDASASVQKL